MRPGKPAASKYSVAPTLCLRSSVCRPCAAGRDATVRVLTAGRGVTRLKLPNLANFPDNAATLYQALIAAGGRGEVLASASIAGLFSASAAN